MGKRKDGLRKLAMVVGVWVGLATPALAIERDINGTWQGIYCGNSTTTFRISTSDPSQSWVSERWCNGFTCGDLDFRITEIDRAGRTFTARAVQGTGWSVTGFSIRFQLSADGQSMTGAYYGHPRCTASQLRKMSGDPGNGPVFSSTVAALPAATSQQAATPSRGASGGSNSASAIMEAMNLLPTDLVPPRPSPGPARPAPYLPADKDRSIYYFKCVGGMRALSAAATRSGGSARVLNERYTAKELTDASNAFMASASMRSPNLDAPGIDADGQERVFASRFASDQEMLGRFVAVCLATGSTEARDAAQRLSDGLK